MTNSQVLKKNNKIVTRVIENETILIPIYQNSNDENCIYTLNKYASAVWGLIDGKKTILDIKKMILEKFNVTSQVAEKEIEKLVKDLKQIKAITEV